jgi:hypothetical protein
VRDVAKRAQAPAALRCLEYLDESQRM